MNRSYCHSKAAAVEAVTEMAITAESAAKPPRKPIQPYVPMSYLPEKIAAVLVSLILMIGATAALIVTFEVRALPEIFSTPAPFGTGWREP